MVTAIVARSDIKRYHNIIVTRLLRGIRQHVGRCENCGGTENLTCHHVDKKCHCGTDYGDNIVILCADCHEVEHQLEHE